MTPLIGHDLPTSEAKVLGSGGGCWFLETIAKIRRDFHVHGKGLKTIARVRAVSRNTVRKIIRSDVTERSYRRGTQAYPVLGPFIEALEELLAENAVDASDILGDLLEAELAEKRARSIRYRLGMAKLPLAKELEDFDFTASPVTESLGSPGSRAARRRLPGGAAQRRADWRNRSRAIMPTLLCAYNLKDC